MKRNFNPVRGTADFLPKESAERENARNIILNNFGLNGFLLVQTPVLEHLELLESSEGGENLRLMFKTVKRGDALNLNNANLTEKDIVSEGLRYDLTVPLVRFYSANREKLPTVFKAIQLDYVFRAERPQKNRMRQFMQCDIDIIGDNSENAEIELITVGMDTLTKLGIANKVLKINDRRILNELIACCGFDKEEINSVCISLDKFDKIYLDGVGADLIEKGFDANKVNKLMRAMEAVNKKGIEALLDFGVNREHILRVNKIITAVKTLAGCECEFNIFIIRGQGYYTGTIFEVFAKNINGAIAGGGRYDDLIEKFTGQKTSAVGFSIGFERVATLISEGNLIKTKAKKLALIYKEQEDFVKVFNQKKEWMKKFDVGIFVQPKNTKVFLEKLKDNGYEYFTNFGEMEIKEIR